MSKVCFSIKTNAKKTTSYCTLSNFRLYNTLKNLPLKIPTKVIHTKFLDSKGYYTHNVYYTQVYYY